MKYSLVFLLFVTCLLNAQDYNKIDLSTEASAKVDSLKQILKTLPVLNGTDADTTRMKLCLDIGDLYETTLPDSAIWWNGSIADTVFNAEKIKTFPRRAKANAAALMNIGIVATYQGDYSKAMDYYERSLKIKEELGDKAGISICLNNLGVVALNQGKYSPVERDSLLNSAMDYHERSLKIKEELGDKEGISACLMNLGAVAYEQGDNSKAVDYYERSLKIKEELGDKTGLANDYPTSAKVYLIQKNIEKAMPLFLRSRDITLGLLKDNFTILSESEKEIYLDKTKSVFNDIHAFNINFANQQTTDNEQQTTNNSLSGICYNNELVLKGLLLKSTAAMLDVVYYSSDPEVKNTYFLFKQYRDKISSLQGTEETNRDSLIDDSEKKANDQERKLVRMSSEFASIEKLFEYKWEDVQKALKPDEVAIEFVSFTQGDRNDTTVYAALVITPESKMPVSIKLFEDNELQKILGRSTGTGYNYVSSLYSANSAELITSSGNRSNLRLRELIQFTSPLSES